MVEYVCVRIWICLPVIVGMMHDAWCQQMGMKTIQFWSSSLELFVWFFSFFSSFEFYICWLLTCIARFFTLVWLEPMSEYRNRNLIILNILSLSLVENELILDPNAKYKIQELCTLENQMAMFQLLLTAVVSRLLLLLSSGLQTPVKLNGTRGE